MDGLRSAVDLLLASLPDRVEGGEDAQNDDADGGVGCTATATARIGSPSHGSVTPAAAAEAAAAAAAAEPTSPPTTLGARRASARYPNPTPHYKS